MIIDSVLLSACPLFEGIGAEDREAMLACLGARQLTCEKDSAIFREGDPAVPIGIVVGGSVQIIREDYYGNRSILARIGPSGLFGETFACAGAETFPVSAVAAEDCTVLLIDSRRITSPCQNACGFHRQMIYNMLKIVAEKNLLLNRKIEIISRRTTREKLMAYLLLQAKQHGSDSFTIPYDRQALADYLEVERSAMSAEISKLRRDGILESEKNRFRLLNQEPH